MEPENCRVWVAMAMAPRKVSLAPPPRPVVGRHHLREEGCGLETLSSFSNVVNDDNNGANDDSANDRTPFD